MADGISVRAQVDTPVFSYGDVVRISDNMLKVHSLQAGHGEWNDDMALVRIITITFITPPPC